MFPTITGVVADCTSSHITACISLPDRFPFYAFLIYLLSVRAQDPNQLQEMRTGYLNSESSTEDVIAE